IRQAAVHEFTEAGPALRLKQCVVQPAGGVADVDVGRDHVVVAGQYDGLFEPEQVAGVLLQPLQPRQLVGEFLRTDRVAVGCVDGCHPHRAAARRYHCLKVPGLVVVIVTRQSGPDFVERQLRQDGNAVVALLAVDGDIVAKILEDFRGKALVGRLDLLQAGDVGLCFADPARDGVEPRPDRVDVPGGDLHCGSVSQIENEEPQPHEAVALGLLIRNDAPMRSSTKSISDPSRYMTEIGSIRTVAPSFSMIRSSSPAASTSSNSYWNPEQPPPSTLTRRSLRSASPLTISQILCAARLLTVICAVMLYPVGPR